METEKYREQFQETCFRPALEELLQKTGEYLEQHTEQIILQIVRPLARLMDKTGKLLANDMKSGQTVWISLSFLRISLWHGRPVLLVQVYRGIPYLKAPLLSDTISAGWTATAFQGYREEVERRVQEEVLGRHIRKPELKSYESKAVSAILRYMFFYMKYAVRNIEEESVWERFGRDQELMISFGEYMDWQLPIAAARQEIELFLCDRETDRTFRRFKELYYEDKDFADWILDDCVFDQCKFSGMTFKGTRLCNTRFVGCSFEQCRFEGAALMGVSFLNCLFGRTVFADCNLTAGWQDVDGQMLYFALGSFRRCIMDNVQWENTETTDNMFADCRLL